MLEVFRRLVSVASIVSWTTWDPDDLRMGCHRHRELCDGKSCSFHQSVRLQ